MKAIFKLNKLLYNFTNITPKHRIELFDELVTPILNYGCEVWGFCQAKQIERTHMMFCKQLLGVKTQNDFIYTVLIVHRIVLFGPGSLLPRWRTEKQEIGRCQLFIIYKCYSELFTSIDQTCERNRFLKLSLEVLSPKTY